MNINCILLGDYKVGKTCLLCSFIDNYFPNPNFPTYDDYHEMVIENETVNLKIFDHPSSEDINRIRSNDYPQADVFVICFSLVDARSFENVEKIWIPEINQYGPNKPFILVGTKSDLRQLFKIHSEIEQISKLQGNLLKERIGAFSYIECSALKRTNLNKVFEYAVLSVIHQNESKKHLCFIE